nr:acyl-CoA dehydratase activase [Treponema sp.]
MKQELKPDTAATLRESGSDREGASATGPFFAGVDAGSASVSVVLLDRDGRLVDEAYGFHHGRVGEAIAELFAALARRDREATIIGIGRTSTTAPLIPPRGDCPVVDGRVAEIEAFRSLHPEGRSLLVVGAEKFARVSFDADGAYRGMRRNSSCAAGTGSFLDIQATRLGLSGGSAEIAAKAAANDGGFPPIASRCSVFAKTDLIHAQAEGWGIEAICEGLCQGLARNIADTLFPGEVPEAPVFMAGGVSRNAAVVAHLGEFAGSKIHVDELSHLYGAIGAAMHAMRAVSAAAPPDTPPAAAPPDTPPAASPGTPAAAPPGMPSAAPPMLPKPAAPGYALDAVRVEVESGRSYAMEPLSPPASSAVSQGASPVAKPGASTSGTAPGPRLSAPSGRPGSAPPDQPPGEGYPDFSSHKRIIYVARKNGPANPVEIDVYLEPEGGAKGARSDELVVSLGLDIGSTSTKAALIDGEGRVVAGFYTRTAGLPLEASQSVFEAIEALGRDQGRRFSVDLAATTGSGRKLVGAVIGADLIVDEITAHARAAYELDPGIDTIIEIGGQDSKFTVMRDGAVTFSQMNAVCAAGTGSFLEEQAARLGVSLADYASTALGKKAPLTSDRCTVFMERDLNHFQSLGYEVGELLAASLFSVCDNYLGKVAREGSIGRRVTFQGATAKNPALVSALERRLGRKLLVSRYCHLTGAIGAALEGRDARAVGEGPAATGEGPAATGEGPAATGFRGFGLHALDLVSRSERCGLCPNDCRLRIVDVGGEEVAYGFLCGRDYGTRRFVRRGGRDVLRERRLAIESAYREARKDSYPRLGWPTIGIPTSLQLAEDAPFWRAFFENLGFPVVVAEDDSRA